MLYRCSDKFDTDDITILIVGNDTKLKHNNVKLMHINRINLKETTGGNVCLRK